jgi:chromosomal replication initiation ATPase DnaA
MSSSQLIFEIPLRASYKAEDFIISDSNQEAFNYTTAWPNWIDFGLFIFGPKACGKTHLATIWAHKSGAKFIHAMDLPKFEGNPLYLVVEDIQNLTAEGCEKLFHLYNTLHQKKGNLMVTADRPLSELNLPLKDLESRLSRLVSIQINQPDEELMRLYIMKLFSDLQVIVSSNEVNYLAVHLNRDFIDVFKVVRLLNTKSIEQKRKITIPFIKSVLENK